MKNQIPKAGVIGWPITHSLSPRVHGYWLREHGIEGSYEAFGVEKENVSDLLKDLVAGKYAGLNVTLPHKEAVVGYLDTTTDLAKRIGAVNTITINENGSLSGSNTDGFGFLENLKQYYPDFKASSGPAVVLGAGGAARAIIVALLDAGVPSIVLTNWQRNRAEELIEDIGGPVTVVDWEDRSKILKDAALLVNTTILGMVGKPPLDIALGLLPHDALVNDIVYAPLETELLKSAKARGNATVDGIGMLLHQARPGFAAWFGVEPQVTDDLRNYVLAGIETDK